jgi:hypothetical protein
MKGRKKRRVGERGEQRKGIISEKQLFTTIDPIYREYSF